MMGRPHCQNRNACSAKTPGKHCALCAARSPETRARKAAAARKLMENPEILARRRASLEANRANPEIENRRKRNLAEAFTRPEVLERHAEGCARAKRRMMEDPAFREKMRIAGVTVGAFNASAMATPEARAKAALSIRAAHLSWCPPEYWDFNKKLKRSGFSLSERQVLIASEVRRKSPEEIAKREAREVIHRITNEMHMREARRKAQAY